MKNLFLFITLILFSINTNAQDTLTINVQSGCKNSVIKETTLTLRSRTGATLQTFSTTNPTVAQNTTDVYWGGFTPFANDPNSYYTVFGSLNPDVSLVEVNTVFECSGGLYESNTNTSVFIDKIPSQITYGMDYTSDSTQFCFYQDSAGIQTSLSCFDCKEDVVDTNTTYTLSGPVTVGGTTTYVLTDSDGNDQTISFTDTNTQRTDAEICAAVAASCNATIGEISYSVNADGDNVASFNFTDNAGVTETREIVFPDVGDGNTSLITKAVDANGAETITHDDGTGVTTDWCVGAKIEDHEGDIINLNCTPTLFNEDILFAENNVNSEGIGLSGNAYSHTDLVGQTTETNRSVEVSSNGSATGNRTKVFSSRNATADGNDSAAFAGNGPTATGASSTATGNLTIASGVASNSAGTNNEAAALNSTTDGGNGNTVEATAPNSSIRGGANNTVKTPSSSIAAGVSGTIDLDSNGGGATNFIGVSGGNSTISGNLVAALNVNSSTFTDELSVSLLSLTASTGSNNETSTFFAGGLSSFTNNNSSSASSFAGISFNDNLASSSIGQNGGDFNNNRNSVNAGSASSSFTGNEQTFTAAGQNQSVTGGLSTVVLGAGAQSTHQYNFLFSSAPGTPFNSAADQEFAVKAVGGFRLRTNNLGTVGVDLQPGGSSWLSVSDSRSKNIISNLSTTMALELLSELDVISYNFKGGKISNAGIKAEQLNEAMEELNVDKKFIGEYNAVAQTDYDALQVAAIQELLKKVKALEAKIKELEND